VRQVRERFPLPFTFTPRLSLAEALIATVAALARILLGSLVFAVWGTYSLVAWTTIRSTLWRVSAVSSLFLAFLISCALLMAGISAFARAISPRTR
jgi:hypothetical protein